MIQLKTRGKPHGIFDSMLATVMTKPASSEVICFSPENRQVVILTESQLNETPVSKMSDSILISGVPSLKDIEVGDVVLVNPNGSVHTLYRTKSPHNSLFITDRCNSNCLMCSQPPRNKDDLDFYYWVNSNLIKMIPPSIQELGITGGEPTLLGNRLIDLFELIKSNLPTTDIHILTNGRSFAWHNIPRSIAQVNNPKMVFGIPLYSDYYADHDYVVQAKGAFTQTVLGFHNAARYGLRVELRIVLHRLTKDRLVPLAKFIYKNLPFVEHVAFMGLEYTGYTPKNSELLWIEPSDYSDQLEESILYLDLMGVNVSIYNLQHCLLKPSLWRFTRNSISDWKREYLDECSKCSQLKDCGGVFATSKRYSDEIKAISI